MFSKIGDITALFYKKWFKIMIILGIFLMLWSPKLRISDPVDENSLTGDIDKKKGLSSWSKDINIKPVSNNSILGSDKPMNTKSTGAKQVNVESESGVVQTIVLRPINHSIKNSAVMIEKNKKLIVEECVRQNPNLAWWSHFDYERDDRVPSMDYVLTVLENKLGKEYIYSDIENGVKIIMTYVNQAIEGSD